MQLSRDTLDLILSYLDEAGGYVLAAPEDADYFRQKINAKRETQNAKRVEEAQKVNAERKMQNAKLEEEVKLPVPVVEVVKVPVAMPVVEKPKVVVAEKAKEVVKEAPAPAWDLSGVRKILSVVAPELAVINEIPSDAIARKIAERWKTKNQSAPISIIVFQEPEEQRVLLEQIAKALDVYFGPARIVQAEKIEKEKQWEAFLSVPDLKTVIICDYTLWQLGNLLQFYKETPAQGMRTLGSVPLFLLPDLSLYLKDPLLKRSLWKALCQKFS